MSDNRRNAWRVTHEGVGWLAAPGFRAACTVEDISVTGACLRVLSIRLRRPHPLPEKLSLTTVLGGERVTVSGVVTRIDRDTDGVCLGVRFFDGDAAGLGWLINQAQRADINAHPSHASLEHRRGA